MNKMIALLSLALIASIAFAEDYSVNDPYGVKADIQRQGQARAAAENAKDQNTLIRLAALKAGAAGGAKPLLETVKIIACSYYSDDVCIELYLANKKRCVADASFERLPGFRIRPQAHATCVN